MIINQSHACVTRGIPSHIKARMRENVDADAHGRSSDQQQHCRETYIFVVHDLVSFASEAMSGWFEASNAVLFPSLSLSQTLPLIFESPVSSMPLVT